MEEGVASKKVLLERVANSAEAASLVPAATFSEVNSYATQMARDYFVSAIKSVMVIN